MTVARALNGHAEIIIDTAFLTVSQAISFISSKVEVKAISAIGETVEEDDSYALSFLSKWRKQFPDDIPGAVATYGCSKPCLRCLRHGLGQFTRNYTQ